jgi:glycosyltransferase involved in cell wall biosynthesis
LADLKTFYSRFGEMPLVSVSNDQRKPLSQANYVATIHHGIPPDLHRPSFEQGSYLAFLGRISPEKRPDRAIRIRARAAARFSETAGGLIDQRRDHFTVVLAAVAAGRTELLRLHRDGSIHDSVLHALEQELDLEEMSARRHLSAS